MSTLTTTSRPTNRGSKIALVVGYLALAGGVLFAYGAPADSYEISIYGSTPIGFWLGLAIALLVAVVVTLYAPEGYVSLAALFLGGAAMISLAGLPLIRNYFFYGSGDALTHLGWTKDIYNGILSVFGLFYPGIHSSSLFMRGVAGSTLQRAMLLTVLSYVVAYIVFVPLCVRSMTSHRGATLLGLLSALLLLPINHLGMNYMTPHPITDSIFLTPIIIYVLINYLTSPTDVFETRLPASAVSAVFAVVLGGIVLYHPQQAANLIILFITVSGVQFLYRVVKPDSRIAEHKTLYGPTVFLIGSFMLWSVGRSRYESSVSAVLRELFSFLQGGAGVGRSTANQGASLAAIGGSIVELFLKLFGVSLVFAALAGLLMLTSLVGRLRDAEETAALVKYLTVGLMVLIPYSFVFYIGSVSELFFRNVGLIMMFSTILGSIALYRYVTGLSGVVPAGGVRAVTAAIVVAMLVLSVAIVFPSPYIFLPNDQVTESQMSGYRFAFDHRGDNTAIYGLREGPWRYSHGTFGVERNPIQQGGRGIPGENISALAGRAPEDRYVAVTDAIRERETEVYRGLRYDRENLSTLDTQPGISLLQTNGEFDLYLVAGSGPAGASATAPQANETGGTAAATPTPSPSSETPTSTPTNGSVFGTAGSTPTSRSSQSNGPGPPAPSALTPTRRATPQRVPSPTSTSIRTPTATRTPTDAVFGTESGPAGGSRQNASGAIGTSGTSGAEGPQGPQAGPADNSTAGGPANASGPGGGGPGGSGAGGGPGP